MKTSAKIEKIIQVADDTCEVNFTMPPDFHFKAGQYITITIPRLRDFPTREQFRDFSICSPPSSLPRLSIVFRKSDSLFKKTLLDMKGGQEVEINGPAGVFTLPEVHDRQLAFVAGGVGIAPFRSMINSALERDPFIKITLLYFNSSIERVAYLDEMKNIGMETNNFDLINVIGAVEEKHFLDILKRVPIFYIAGPPGMVRRTRNILLNLATMDINIKTEEFTGY